MADSQEYKKTWRRIYTHMTDYWQVLRHGKHPKHCSIYYNRLQLMALGNFPNKEERRSFVLRMWHFFVVGHIDLFFITMFVALPESANSLVDTGQDILWLLGCFYMIFKWHFLHVCADQVDEVVTLLDELHLESKNERCVNKVRAHQRYHFLLESTLCFVWHVGVFFFLILTMTQPVFSNQALPFHSIYPFDWHDPEKHPTAHTIVYIWQCWAVCYNVICILYCELMSAHIFTQIGCNLKILCIEIECLAQVNRDNVQVFRRELYKLVEFHNRIINLVARTNQVFYSPMVMQMCTSFLLISLATFVSLVARREPKVAMRFVLFMALTFFHLSYWCFSGDHVTSESRKVAIAAYDAYLCSPYKPAIQRDIMFIIQRAQSPLSMGAAPFPPLNLISYMANLKQCYSILTLLLESLD